MRLRPLITRLVVSVLTLGALATALAAGREDVLDDEKQAQVHLGSAARAGAHVGPTLVFQSGLGDGKAVWRPVVALLPAEDVFAYDRPGRGAAADVEGPRDPCTIAAELRSRLRQAGVAPPYILVGHSLGGTYQYVFARLYPDEVAGLVLLDPTHPRHLESMERDVPELVLLLKVLKTTMFRSIDRREFDDMGLCMDKVATLPPLAMPTRVLVSGRFKEPEKGEFAAMLKRLRPDWLKLTPAPRLQTIHDSGHYIQRESPEDVVEAIQAVRAPETGGRP